MSFERNRVGASRFQLCKRRNSVLSVYKKCETGIVKSHLFLRFFGFMFQTYFQAEEAAESRLEAERRAIEADRLAAEAARIEKEKQELKQKVSMTMK